MVQLKLNMVITEENRDLFTVPSEFYLAHCISGDYALGAGIAKKFNSKFNMRSKLFENYAVPHGEEYCMVGKALLIDKVFNLVTKTRYFQKPTYDTLRASLNDMRKQCESLNITKVAMPLIGCGLDRLEWDKVKCIISDVFKDIDIQILVCKL